jgi:CheY-like chemotaxis protein
MMNKSIRILIVEDDEPVALDTRRRLESFGYQVAAVVTGGVYAIEQASALRPDLVLVGNRLKCEMDSVEVAEKIRRLEIPAIVRLAAAGRARNRARRQRRRSVREHSRTFRE